MPAFFDNKLSVVRDDLLKTIKNGSRISIASACFSLYAYKELKEQLENCEQFKFIFTSPTYIKEPTERKQREFYISRLKRENSLYGTEFEVRLRNELTQKAVATECAEWIRKKARFKSNITNRSFADFMLVDNGEEVYNYSPMKEFTTVSIGCKGDDSIMDYCIRIEAPESKRMLSDFNYIWDTSTNLEDVTEQVIESISAVYNDNSPELIYFMALYNIFNEFLEDISDDFLPNEATGFKNSVIWNKLFNFQKDAALAIINKLEKYNGCILADSVGLGKTFTALSVIKYYEERNRNVLVLCPKKLSENWRTYNANLKNNSLAGDRFRYDVLHHTDLSRDSGESNGIPLDRVNWGNYDLIVIDESHNFRNGIGTHHSNDRENRYMRLMNRIIKPGVKTKVLMLSATPVNNRFNDLKNQLALCYEGDASIINDKLKTKASIDTIFSHAQAVYNAWSKRPEEERTTENLLSSLDFDFFELLDSVTIARSRKHIQKYYDVSDIGKFPTRMKPISLRPRLTYLENAVNYSDVYYILDQLKLTIYTPMAFILPSRVAKYVENDDTEKLKRGREHGIQRLMSINLLKRMESSVHSFRLTLTRICEYMEHTNNIIEEFIKSGAGNLDNITDYTSMASDFDYDDQNDDFLSVGKKVKIDLSDMDYMAWQEDIKKDIENIGTLLLCLKDITPEHDNKLNELRRLIDKKDLEPINPGNKKIIIFTAFADTAEYLYENISVIAKEHNKEIALITGAGKGKTTIPKFDGDINRILTCFSPISKERDVIYPNEKADIDILIATDCISEGQNLQDADFCINYDIHWNPVRIIQRFGRIDRIGSQNEYIQLVNFWPDLELDDYINLKATVENRMRISVLSATGDDDLVNANEKGDLAYRHNQLKKLQEEVVDLEEMNSGVSIMDLGLNEFRMDLLAFMKHYDHIERTPLGIHAVVEGEKKGVVFVLKNVNESINIENQNRLHPFYMVYISDEGEVITNHLQSKETLDIMRYLAINKSEPNRELCKKFNKSTKDGRNMAKVSQLLENAIQSIIELKEEKDIESFFTSKKTTFGQMSFTGLDDFELICFMVVM